MLTLKVLDVESLQAGIDEIVKDIESKIDQIQTIQRAVNHFHSLEDSLKGQGGEAIRAFYEDTHEPFLVFLHQSLIDYENLLNNMLETVEAFESSGSGHINLEFLKSDVLDGFDKVKTQTMELTDDANSIINSVKDLVEIKEIDESSVVENVRYGKENVEHIIEELIVIDEYEASQLDQTAQDLQLMTSYLSEMESRFKSGDISVKNYNVESIADMAAYNAIKDRVNNKEQTELSALYGDEIRNMPMSEIEKMYDNVYDDLPRNDKKLLEKMYQDFLNGDIDRDDFADFFTTIVHKGDTYDASDNFIEYIGDNASDIGVDLSEDILVEILKDSGNTQKAASIIDKAFGSDSKKITDFVTKHSSKLQGAGISMGPLFTMLGLGTGIHNDMTEHDKSIGQAITHNMGSIWSGALGGAGGAAIVTAALSNPGGWIIGGGAIVGGTIVSTTYDYLYENNILYLQDGLDFAGEAIEDGTEVILDGLDTVGQAMNNSMEMYMESVNEVSLAIEKSLESMNPFNW